MSGENARPVEVAGPLPILSEGDQAILTEARTASWKVEQYEFAYDMTVRLLSSMQTWLEFLGVAVAILFLSAQWVNPDKHSVVEHWIGVVGTLASLVVILGVIWAAIDQWKSRIEKMRMLSSEARRLLRSHAKITNARPVDHPGIRKWLLDLVDFEEQRKEPLATVWTYCLKKGYQHLGNRYPGCGIKCGVCGKEWTHELNKRTRWSWWPFYGCSSCGA